MTYPRRLIFGMTIVFLLAAPSRAAAADPHIRRIEPDSGMGGAHITIHGSGFGSTPDLVRIGWMQAQILNWSDSRIEVAVLPGTVSGSLTVRRGQQWSNPIRFTVPSPQSVD